MARRNVSADDIDFSGYYNEPEINPITMAMQLLGMEAKQEESDAAKLMSWMQMQSEEQRAEEALGLQREQLGETRVGNVEARRLAAMQENRLGRALDEDVLYKKGQQDIERQKVIASALEKVAGVPQLSPEARLLIRNIPGMEEPFAQLERETEMKAVMPQLRAAYANTDAAKRDAAIQMLYGQMSPTARANAPWQDLNALIKPDAPGFWSRFGGAGTPPTAGTVTGPAVNPALAQGEAGRRAGLAQQPLPSTEFEYQEGYPSAQPNYMYGIETPIPADVINRVESDPRYRSAEQDVLLAIKDWWNRSNVEPTAAPGPTTQQTNTYPYGNYGGPSNVVMPEQAAPTFSIDQLMALLSNSEEAERLPWLYGGKRWELPETGGVPQPPDMGLAFDLLNAKSKPMGVR